MSRNVGIELCALNLWRELQRPCDKGRKLSACDGGVGMAFSVPVAVDDPILGKRLDNLRRPMSLCIREGGTPDKSGACGIDI